jgi:hypothetical protein
MAMPRLRPDRALPQFSFLEQNLVPVLHGIPIFWVKRSSLRPLRTPEWVTRVGLGQHHSEVTRWEYRRFIGDVDALAIAPLPHQFLITA